MAAAGSPCHGLDQQGRTHRSALATPCQLRRACSVMATDEGVWHPHSKSGSAGMAIKVPPAKLPGAVILFGCDDWLRLQAETSNHVYDAWLDGGGTDRYCSTCLRFRLMAAPIKVSETHFFCEFSSPERKRLQAGVLYLVVDNILDPEGDEAQEFYVLAYGYAGGGAGGDWLFKRDSYHSRWVYGDTSGDEWRGAREMSDGGHLYDQEVDEIPEWTSQDTECYEHLMELRDLYFVDGEDDLVNVSDSAFEKNKQSDSLAHSEGFDMDVLYDISPIWSLTTHYEDPYYAS